MTKHRVKSLDRALDIVELISRSGEEGVSVSEVARANGTTKSNAHGILETLVDRGYLSDSGQGMMRRFRLGSKFLQMASAASAQRPISQVVHELLAKVSRSLGLPSRFGILDDSYAVALYKQDAPGPIQFTPYLGRREFPHCSGMGKALMTTLTEAEVRAVLESTGMPKRTDKTITNVDVFLEDLRISRIRGFALDNEEDHEGVFCIGALVPDADDSVAGAISVSGLKQSVSDAELLQMGEQLVRLVAGSAARAPE